MTCSRGVRCLALLPLLGALAFLRISGQTSPTSVHGLLMVREIGQTDRPAANVHVRALDAGGNTQDVSDSNATGGFSLRVPGTISIYRLLIEDIYNRWWPVERNDLKNDPQHANLGTIILNPQKAPPPDPGSVRSAISGVRRFDAFTASVEELYFDMGVPLSGKSAIISGAGSSDAGPLYQTWASLYSAVHPRVKVDYQPLGAGRGMQQLTEGAITFGATDVPLSEEQLSVFRKAGGRVLQLPAAMNAVVLIQNLSQAAIGLQLTPEAAAGIYLGTIKTWRDPAISGSNPGIELPDTPIRPIYRSDASGFTDAFTNYLAGGSNTWRNEVGVGLSPKWPVGTGARGDAGIAATVAETKGSIGYVSFSYAVQNHLTGDRLANRQKLFVPATVASIATSSAMLSEEAETTGEAEAEPGAEPTAEAED